MKLTLTVRAALLLYAVGMVIFFVRDQDQMTWFALGGGLALVNILAAAWSVKMGLISLQKSGLILGLFLVKSFTFLALVAAILLFLKPMLLPFTLGLGIVIVGSVGAAIWESRHLIKKEI
jgi:hypothetical protein